MTRWIFIFLVFANILFYYWQSIQPKQPYANPLPVSQTNQPTIFLLSEKGAPLRKKITPEEAAITDQGTNNICLYLGGFANKEQLNVISSYTQQIDKSLTPQKIELTESMKFQLYLTPKTSNEITQILQKITAAGLDGILIPRGKHAHSISFGNFISKEASYPIQEQLKTLGLTPILEELPKTAQSYWLKIPTNQRTIFKTDILARLANQLPTTQQNLMSCQIGTELQ